MDSAKIPEPRGERIRAFRKKAGLSQEKLAEMANLNPVTIRRIELGQSWSVYSLETLARALQVKPANFYDLQEMKDFISDHDTTAVPVLESSGQPSEPIPLDKDAYERYELLPGLFRDRIYRFTFLVGPGVEWHKVNASASASLGLESGCCIRRYCTLQTGEITQENWYDRSTCFNVYAIGDVALTLLDMTRGANVEVIASSVYGTTLGWNWDGGIDEPKQYEDHTGFLVHKILSYAS